MGMLARTLRHGVCLGILASQVAWAQGEPLPTTTGSPTQDPPAVSSPSSKGVDISELSLEDLLNQQTSVATKRALSTREVPNVITIVTRQEMQDAGARDLTDVLMMVPGFNLGFDVQGVMGLSFRGNWAHEGKILMMIDGQEMNEAMYSTTPVGNRFLVDTLERVEIIRGPGSAIYGGYAELAVINLVTRGAKQEGASLTFTHGSHSRGFARRNLSMSVGTDLNGWGVSLNGYIGQGNRSDRTYTDIYGTSYFLSGNAAQDPAHLNANVTYKGLNARVIYDRYNMTMRDDFVAIRPDLVTETFTHISTELLYDWSILDNLKITPRLNFRSQTPWTVTDPSSDIYYIKNDQRILSSLTASWDVWEGINLLGGVEHYFERARLLGSTLTGFQDVFATNGAYEVSYRNVALYAQAQWENPIVNVTAGVRFENHSFVGPYVVPRVGLTRQFGRVHAKLLYAGAFRAPGVENINFALDPTAIKRETTRVFEAEVGWQFTDNWYLGLNAFDTTINDPIIYAYDPVTDSDSYSNQIRTGTRGAEAELRMKYAWGWATLAYSYFIPGGKNLVDKYMVPGQPDQLLGQSRHKITLNSAFHPFWKQLTVSPSLVLLSERYATFSGQDPVTAEYYVQGETRPSLLVNLYASYSDLVIKGLEVGAGVYNIAGEPFKVPQPYRSGHAPMPALSREFLVRVGYSYTF
jgi:outer membrane receptor protein involved in Fe transport